MKVRPSTQSQTTVDTELQDHSLQDTVLQADLNNNHTDHHLNNLSNRTDHRLPLTMELHQVPLQCDLPHLHKTTTGLHPQTMELHQLRWPRTATEMEMATATATRVATPAVVRVEVVTGVATLPARTATSLGLDQAQTGTTATAAQLSPTHPLRASRTVAQPPTTATRAATAGLASA